MTANSDSQEAEIVDSTSYKPSQLALTAGAKLEAIRGSLSNNISGSSFVLTGSTGWFGTAFMDLVSLQNHPLAVLKSSRDSRVYRFGRLDRVEGPDYLPNTADFYFDFAFVTQDKLLRPPLDSKTANLNDDLIQKSIEILKSGRFGRYSGVSSGAALNPEGPGSYGHAKASFEELYFEQRSDQDRVARVWSVSGGFCSKPDVFAFANFMNQARNGSSIRIEAPGRVFRRYCAIEEIFAGLCSEKSPPLFNSGGELIEMEELAEAVRFVINPKAEVQRDRDFGVVDSIYSHRESDFEDLMRSIGLTPMSLLEQVENAKRGLD